MARYFTLCIVEMPLFDKGMNKEKCLLVKSKQRQQCIHYSCIIMYISQKTNHQRLDLYYIFYFTHYTQWINQHSVCWFLAYSILLLFKHSKYVWFLGHLTCGGARLVLRVPEAQLQKCPGCVRMLPNAGHVQSWWASRKQVGECVYCGHQTRCLCVTVAGSNVYTITIYLCCFTCVCEFRHCMLTRLYFIKWIRSFQSLWG